MPEIELEILDNRDEWTFMAECLMVCMALSDDDTREKLAEKLRNVFVIYSRKFNEECPLVGVPTGLPTYWRQNVAGYPYNQVLMLSENIQGWETPKEE